MKSKTALKIALLSAGILLLFASPSKAWNCSVPGQVRVQVPTGTLGSGTGDGSGQVVVDGGLTFICEVLPTPPTPPTTPTPTPAPSQNQTQNQNQTQSQNQQSTANSQSESNSNSSVQVGPLSNQGTVNGTATSTLSNSGNATLSNSGNATLSNSGNSTNSLKSSVTNAGNSSNSNSNKNVSQGGSSALDSTIAVQSAGGAGGTGGNSQASASNNGNGANNSEYSNSTRVQAAASSALSTALPTAPCVIGTGAGAQSLLGGLSFSGGKVDKNCAILETARSFANFGSDIAYCKTMLTDKFAIQAGVTMQDCLQTRKVVPVLVPQPAQVIQPPQVIVNIPAPVPVSVPVQELIPPVQELIPPVQEDTSRITELGNCNIYNGISNVCKRIVDNAILALQQNPSAQLVLMGPHQGAEILNYLHSRGVSSARVRMSFDDEQNWILSFELFTINQ